MKATDLIIGQHYKANVSGRLVTVRLDSETEVWRYRGVDCYSGRRATTTRTAYNVTNLDT